MVARLTGLRALVCDLLEDAARGRLRTTTAARSSLLWVRYPAVQALRGAPANRRRHSQQLLLRLLRTGDKPMQTQNAMHARSFISFPASVFSPPASSSSSGVVARPTPEPLGARGGSLDLTLATP